MADYSLELASLNRMCCSRLKIKVGNCLVFGWRGVVRSAAPWLGVWGSGVTRANSWADARLVHDPSPGPCGLQSGLTRALILGKLRVCVRLRLLLLFLRNGSRKRAELTGAWGQNLERKACFFLWGGSNRKVQDVGRIDATSCNTFACAGLLSCVCWLFGVELFGRCVCVCVV